MARVLDDRPVGCGAVRKLDETTGEIKRMWVDPAARGRGVGRQLLRALEGAAVELGCETVYLDTSAHLVEAIALYRSFGYEIFRPTTTTSTRRSGSRSVSPGNPEGAVPR